MISMFRLRVEHPFCTRRLLSTIPGLNRLSSVTSRSSGSRRRLHQILCLLLSLVLFLFAAAAFTFVSVFWSIAFFLWILSFSVSLSVLHVSCSVLLLLSPSSFPFFCGLTDFAAARFPPPVVVVNVVCLCWRRHDRK